MQPMIYVVQDDDVYTKSLCKVCKSWIKRGGFSSIACPKPRKATPTYITKYRRARLLYLHSHFQYRKLGSRTQKVHDDRRGAGQRDDADGPERDEDEGGLSVSWMKMTTMTTTIPACVTMTLWIS